MKTPVTPYIEHGREVRFDEAPEWTLFAYGDSVFIKRSPRTAACHWPAGPDNVRFKASDKVLTLQGVE